MKFFFCHLFYVVINNFNLNTKKTLSEKINYKIQKNHKMNQKYSKNSFWLKKISFNISKLRLHRLFYLCSPLEK